MISRRVQFLIATLIAGSVIVTAAGAPSTPVRAQAAIDPADFQTAITNPLYPISLIGPKVFKGQETDGRTPNGFGVSYSNGEPDARSFVKAMEDFDAAYKNPAQRAAMIRAALAVTPQVNVARTAEETLRFYENLLGSRQNPQPVH